MEELLVVVLDCLDVFLVIYNILINVDMIFGMINDEDGNEIEFIEGNYFLFIRSKNRGVRKVVFEKLFGEYSKLKNILVILLFCLIKSFNFSSKVRKYNSVLEVLLKFNNIFLDVYKNVIKVMNNNFSLFYRYIIIKKKLLGLDEIYMYDLYVLVIEV